MIIQILDYVPQLQLSCLSELQKRPKEPLHTQEEVSSLGKSSSLIPTCTLIPLKTEKTPLLEKKKKKKFIWTLVIISVWENNQGVKLSKWNSEKSRASRDLKGQKGSRKKYAGLYHGNSNEAKLKKPRQWAELLYYKLLPATGLHKSTLLSWLGNYRATRVVSDSRGSLPSITICVNQSILVYSWEMKEKKRLKNWTVLCGLLFTDGDVWVGKTTFLLLESLTTGGWVSSHTGWFLCQLGLLAMCRR